MIYSSVGQESVIESDRRLVTLTSLGEVQISNPSIYTVRCKLNVRFFLKAGEIATYLQQRKGLRLDFDKSPGIVLGLVWR